jgi:hypothetical protein
VGGVLRDCSFAVDPLSVDLMGVFLNHHPVHTYFFYESYEPEASGFLGLAVKHDHTVGYLAKTREIKLEIFFLQVMRQPSHKDLGGSHLLHLTLDKVLLQVRPLLNFLRLVYYFSWFLR